LLLKKMADELKVLSNKARFVEEVCRGDLIVSNRKRKELLANLKEHGYDLIPKEDKKAKPDEGENDDKDSVDESASDADFAKGYEVPARTASTPTRWPAGSTPAPSWPSYVAPPADDDRISIVFVGEGGAQNGRMAELLNAGAKDKFPLLVVVTDNGQAINTFTEDVATT
jgi:hypothetical protein